MSFPKFHGANSGEQEEYLQIYNEKRKLINAALSSVLDDIANINQFKHHMIQDWLRILRQYIEGGGKRFRPVLAVLAYEAIRGEEPSFDVLKAISTLELMHVATLIHDDIIDHDELRRGEPSFHIRYKNKAEDEKRPDPYDYGTAVGLIAGDAVYSFAFYLLSVASSFTHRTRVYAIHEIVSGMISIVAGAFRELEFVGKKISEEEYLSMIEDKTSALFVAAISLGGHLAEANDKQIQSLRHFALKLGNIFQIVDDYLGVFGDSEVTGKPNDGDIREGKNTLLVVRSYEMGDPESLEALDQLLGDDNIDELGIKRVREIFSKIGAKQSVQQTVLELYLDIVQILDNADPPFTQNGKRLLKMITQLVSYRVR